MTETGIFIVEPDAAVAQLVALVLRDEGYAVECASSPDEALVLLAARGPDAFQVVLSTTFAPQASAPYIWLDRLRACTRAAIVICTRSPAALYADYHAPGYAGVLEEPYDVHQLLDAVAVARGEQACRSA